MRISDKKIKLVLLVQLLIFISSISVSAAEWKGQEYKSYYYPPSNEVIDNVKQKTMEKYNLSEEYFDEHLILSSADVYCHESRYNEYNPSCMAKRENPHLLQQIQINWIFVPEQEEYKEEPFFITPKFFVGVTIYDEEGLSQAVKDMEQNTGFDMGRIVIDDVNNVIYSFPTTDILEVIRPSDRLISKDEAKSKLLGCVGSFASEPHISYERGFIYMGANGPSDLEGKHKFAQVNLENGDIIQCSTVGPAILEDGSVINKTYDQLDNQPAKQENIIKKFFNWLSKLFKNN